MNTLKKIGTIVVCGVFLLATLVGCTQKIPLEEHKAIVNAFEASQNDLQTQISVLSEKALVSEELQSELALLQEKFAEQEARDAQVLADYEALKAQIEVEETPVEPVAAKEVVSYTYDDLGLGAIVPDITLDDGDVEFLFDGEIKFAETDFDVQEKIVLKDLIVATSLAYDEDFENLAALTFNSEEAIQYRYIFDDTLNYSLITEKEPLVISMLGKEYTIIEVTPVDFTIVEGTQYVLSEGEKITIDGKELSIVTIAENGKVYVKVGDKTAILDEGESEEVNGLDVRADETVYTGKATSQSFATLTISGEDAEKTIVNGDEYIKDDKRFEWVLETNSTTTTLESIGINYVEKANDADEAILYPEKSLDVAGLFGITFQYEKDVKYADFEVSFDTATTSDIPCVLFESQDGEKIILGDEELETAWYNGTSVYYKDDHNDWQNSTLPIKLVNSDVTYNVTYNNGTLAVGPMSMPVTNMTYFGTIAEEAEALDLVINGTSLGKRDTSILLTDGAIISAPEDDLDDDKLSFKIPDEIVKAQIIVSK